MDNRQSAVDVLKGLAIVGVVLHHVKNRRFDADVQEHLLGVIHVVAWAVYAFMFGSGYLHALSRRAEAAGGFIGRRAQRLLVPYLWLGVLYAVVFQVIQNLGLVDYDPTRIEPNLLGKVKSLLLCDQEHVIGEQLYFFVLLFGISSAFVLLLAISTSTWFVAWLVGVLAVVLAGLMMVNPLPLATTGLSVEMLVGALLQYALGFLLGRTRDALGRWHRVAVGGVVVAAALAAINGPAGYSVAMLWVPLTLFLILNRLVAGSPWFGPWAALGQASGSIFAFHTPFILQPLLIILFKLKVPQYANVAISVLVTLVLCVAIHKVLNRYSWLRWFRI